MSQSAAPEVGGAASPNDHPAAFLNSCHRLAGYFKDAKLHPSKQAGDFFFVLCVCVCVWVQGVPGAFPPPRLSQGVRQSLGRRPTNKHIKHLRNFQRRCNKRQRSSRRSRDACVPLRFVFALLGLSFLAPRLPAGVGSVQHCL